MLTLSEPEVTETPDRFQRQADLVPRDKLTDAGATIIGVGAGGRNVALQLAAIGVKRLQLIDFDTVELPNTTTQGYSRHDIGRPKVEALAVSIRQLTDDCKVETVVDRFRPSIDDLSPVIFCCVDKIDARRAIFNQAGKRSEFWCDGRMLGETIRVVTAANDAGRLYYPKTLFSEGEANAGRCTAMSTIYGANIAAGLMVHQFTRWLRGLPVDNDLTFNLLASDLFDSTETE
jgi:hypothetical protein